MEELRQYEEQMEEQMPNAVAEKKKRRKKTKEELTAYNREYKKKQYTEHRDKFCNVNKSYYYKKKFNISDDEYKRYGLNLHNVLKIRENLDELYDENPQVLSETLKEMLKKYICVI